jgi:serine/threonine-protein kinase RsbW
MNIKLGLITKNRELISKIKNFIEKSSFVELTVISRELSDNDFLKYKFDVVIFDKKINSNWIKIFEIIKFININAIFLVIVDRYSIDEIKTGFKKGIFEVLSTDIDKEDFFLSISKALNYALSKKSIYKISKFCEHNIKFDLPSDIELVIETVDVIMEAAKTITFIENLDIENNLRLIYTEAIVNAMKHGNKYDKNKKVYINVIIRADKIIFSVEDEGDGFNIEKLKNPLDEDNILGTSGRGIFLMNKLTDKILIENNGKKLILINKKK